MRYFLKKVASLYILLHLTLFLPTSVQASELLSPWSVYSSLTGPTASHFSFSFENFVFVLGGATNDDSATIQSIDTNSADGQWRNLLDFDYPVYWHSGDTKNNRVYILGGTQYPPQKSIDNVSTATIDNSGNVSAWIQLNNLPLRLSKGASVVAGDFIYYSGGWTDNESVDSSSDGVYYAHIKPDGSLGDWEITTPLPTVLWGHKMIEAKGNLYVLGGWKNGYRTSEVLASQINLDGSISKWVNKESLPEELENFGTSVIDDYIVTVGGGSNNGLTSSVYYTKVHEDGNISPWSLSSSSLPSPMCCGSAVKSNGYLYITGGFNGEYSDRVFRSKIATDLSTPPTPTPPTTKILLIPGTGASWNSDAILNCKTTGYHGSWSMAPYAKDVYSDLISTLQSSGYEVLPYYYDWRKPVSTHNDDLENVINNSLSNNEKIDLIGHSMGGLIGQSYLQSKTSYGRLGKFLAVGAPFNGTLLTYPAWEAGEVVSNDLLFRIGATMMMARCGAIGINSRSVVQIKIPSIQNMLPRQDYLENLKHALKPVASMTHQNNWLPDPFVPPFHGVKVGTLSGTNKSTIYKIRVKPANKLDIKLGNWMDGRPIQYLTTKNGDGTVLSTSSSLAGAINFTVNQTHSGLVNTTDGINKILEFFEASSPNKYSSLTQNDPQSALVIISDSGNFSIIKNGIERKSQDGMVAIVNPKKESINISNLTQDSGNIIVAQFLADGRTIWKEYAVHKRTKKNAVLDFDPLKIKDDILRWYP